MTSISINEKRILTKRLLTETLLTRTHVLDTKWKPKKPWADRKDVESKLKEIGALPFPGDMMDPENKPAHYELIVQGEDGAHDRLVFYSSGTVYSENEGKDLAARVDAGQLVLLDPNIPDAKGQPAVAATLIPTTIKYTDGGISKSIALITVTKAEAEESNEVLDTLQMILDWAGLIPGIGDVLDIINAVIYFARGKYLDGLLSSIAIIPIVGSVLSLTLKTVFKPLKWVGKAIADVWHVGKSADEIWIAVKNSNKLTPEQLKLLAEGMQKFGNDVAGFRSWLTKNQIPGLSTDAAVDVLKKFEDFCGANTRSINDLLDASRKTATAVDASRTAFKTGRKVGEFAYKPLRNILNRAKKIGLLPEKKILQLSQALDLRFMRKMKADPKRLAAILSTTPNARATLKFEGDVLDFIEGRIKSLPNGAQEFARFEQQILAGGAAKGRMLSPDDWTRSLDYIKNNPQMANLYDEVGGQFANFAMQNDNILYNTYRTSTTSNLGALLSTKDMTAGGILQSLDFSWRKNADILWNEIQDMGEDAKIELGLSEKDDINGLLYPTLKVALDLAERVPGIGDPLAKTREIGSGVVKKAVQLPILGGIARTAMGGSQMPYVPKDYKVVDDDDPRLKNQEKETETRKKVVKRFF